MFRTPNPLPVNQTGHLAVIGGGPAGLMAAEVLLAAGHTVDLYEQKGSVGRKFLIAGKGGLNLTHGEPFDDFVLRYRERSDAASGWLRGFDADDLRQWAGELGVETYVGSSGRVFPLDRKAAPLLRGWLRRLRAQGLHLHVRHRLVDLRPTQGGVFALHLQTQTGAITRPADAVVLALGGGSWPQLGSDAHWVQSMSDLADDLRPLRPSNGGFECRWTEGFRQRFAGAAVKPVALHWHDGLAGGQKRQGEFVITAEGVEGSLIYAASAALRETLERDGAVTVHLDLMPASRLAALQEALSRPRGRRSIGEHLRRSTGLQGVRAGLLFELADAGQRRDAATLARLIKHLPLVLLRCRPMAEAISSAGGVRLEALDAHLMWRRHPGVFFAGEMLDWEAPTGGYLLQACLASGRHAAHGVLDWLKYAAGTDPSGSAGRV